MKDSDKSKKRLLAEIESLRRRIYRLESEKARLSQLIPGGETGTKNMTQQYLDVVHTMIVELDSTGKVTQINKRGCEILGYEEREIIGKNWFDKFLPKYFGPEVKKVFKELMAGNLEAQRFFENPVLAKDGEERLIAWHNTILKDLSGKITGTLSSGLDITDDFYALEALKESEEHLRAVYEAAEDVALVTTDLAGEDTRILGFSPGAERIFGYSKEEIIGEKVAILHPVEVVKDFPSMQDALHQGKKGYAGEAILKRKSGEKFPALLTIYPHYDSSGELIGTIRVSIDITDLERTRRDLKKEKDRAQKYLDMAGVILVALDAAGKITLLNRKGCEILESSSDEAIGADWFENFVPEENREKTKAAFGKLMAGNIEPVEYFENIVLARSGKKRIIAWHNIVLEDESGNITGTLSSGEDITERRRIEREIRESEKRYQDLFNSVLEGIGFTDQNENIKFCNPAFARIFGFDNPDDLMGRNLMDFVHEDDVDLVMAESRKREKGEISRYEMRIRTPDGRIRTILAAVSPKFEEGEYAGAFGSIIDITDRKEVEEALQQSEERYRAIWYSSPSGICLTDEKGIYRYVNPAYCRMYGYSEEQLIGRSFFDLIVPPDAREERMKLYSERFKTTQPIKMGEAKFVKSNGDPVLVEYAGDFIRTRGKIEYLVSINIDVTERKQAETLLRESEEKYRTLIEQSNDAIYLMVNDRLEYVNQRFIDMFGYSEEEPLSPEFPIMNLVAPSNREFIESRERRIEAGEDLPTHYEFTAIDKNGKEIEVEVSVSYVTYKGRKATQGIIHDSTERKALEAQLLQSQKMESIGRLAGGVAHDFNNLLTAITGHSELAEMQLKEDDPLLEDIRTIQEAAKRGADLASQLLASLT